MKKLATIEKRPVGRPKKIFDHRKLAKVHVVLPDSPVERLENLLIFDAKCLDRETQHELLRILPQLIHIRHAWKAEYMEYGCLVCHKKNAEYSAGGMCNACCKRVYMRMRNRFRKATRGRDLPAELAAFRDALQLKYNAAQRLFNGDD